MKTRTELEQEAGRRRLVEHEMEARRARLAVRVGPRYGLVAQMRRKANGEGFAVDEVIYRLDPVSEEAQSLRRAAKALEEWCKGYEKVFKV